MSETFATFADRVAKLTDNIADEFRALADTLRRPDLLRDFERTTATYYVIEEIAGTARLALDNYQAGRYTQAMKRLEIAERAYADTRHLIERRIEDERSDASPLRAVEDALSGRLAA